MKIFKPIFLVSFLVFTFLCFGIPIVINSPTFETERPTVISPIKFPHQSTNSKRTFYVGPTQPEVQSFKPSDANDLVDLFTGDFSYNIPLLDVGGYPLNIFYTSNISMEDEASWVGLGWNLNPGVINRNVRGLPDDFSGDSVTKSYNLKQHVTFGGTIGAASVELFGFPVSNPTLGIKYNNYSGIGLDLGAGFGTTFPISGSINGGVSANLGLSSDGGATISPSVSLSSSVMKEGGRVKTGGKLTAGFSWNSLDGLNSIYLAPSLYRNINWRKENQTDYLFQGSTTFPLTFARQTYTPSTSMPMKNLSLSFKLKAGVIIQGIDLEGSVGCFYSSQTLVESKKINKAYGYMYSQFGKDEKDALHDFNREKDGAFEIDHPDLPVVNSTYDVYTVSGQGISATFRPFRSDIGTVSDPSIETVSNSGGLGLDIAGALIAKIGGDLEVSESKTYTGKWTSSSNEAKSFFNFKSPSDVTELKYEPVYFKNVGEKNVLINNSFYNSIGKRQPMRLELEGDFDTKAKPKLLATDNSTTILSTENTVKKKRENRNINFQFLTVQDALFMANEPLIKVYTGNSDGDTVRLERTNRNGIKITDKQISEIIILKDDGTRYVYGLPAYNLKKDEVSFNISNQIDETKSDSSTLMEYNPGVDNSTNNKNGTNNYYSKIETPAYAYAYYLTAILSPDYVDLSGDGASSDDLGNYTRFNYYRISNYKWRSPHQKNMAFFSSGHLYDENDDMGNYQYGEKEVFYLRDIETKNYVAVFDLADRKDSYGVLDENGEIDLASTLKKLSSISLYTKNAYLKNDKTPIKKVNFEYDYSLCKKNPSSNKDSGKLTLKRIYFTYLRSGKGKNSGYNFKYNGLNPDYSLAASDRWGTYKSVKKREPTSGGGVAEQQRLINNNQFPYTDQENRTVQADPFASAWALTDIKLPSGGQISVQYEADDYGYVQNRRVMQMMQVLGFSTNQTDPPTNFLYTNFGTIGSMNNSYLHIKTTQPITQNNVQVLLKGIEDVYFQSKVNITSLVFGSGTKYFEPVDGFFQLANKNITIVDPFHIVIQVKSQGIYHPFTLATLRRIKNEFTGIAYKFPEINDDPLGNLANALVGLAKAATDILAGGLYNRLIGEGVAREIDPHDSYVRLNVPNMTKIGGGSRVKKIDISDDWGKMSSGRDSTKKYSIEYSYTRTGENNQLISSGVASYEPTLGGNENPFLLPDYYNVSKKFSFSGLQLFEVENELKYVTTPFGESFFPGPSVGYSNVTVKQNPHPDIRKHSTGKTEYAFYTAYDFPTIYLKTDVSVKQFKQFLPLLIFNSNTDKVAASQGYYIEMNDMHGKPKGVYSFSEADSVNPISGKTIYYKQANNTLNNAERVVDKNGKITQADVGIETDIVVDERESSSQVITGGLDLNVVFILAGILPLPIPIPIPKYSREDILFRSICVTKVSQRSGLIDSIISFDNGAKIITKPLLYDAVTGNEVLSVMNNEFHDPIYTLNIPAHWVHEGMGPAFYNYGIQIENVSINANGSFDIPNAKDTFFVGDEILLTAKNGFQGKGWVLSISGNDVVIIDAAGDKILNYYSGGSLKVIRSGRRNMQSISLGQVVMKQNPAQGNKLDLNSAKQIINSNALQFSDQWQTYAAFNIHPQKLVCDCASGNHDQDSVNRAFASSLLTAITIAFQNGDSITGRFYTLHFTQSLLKKYFNLYADTLCYNVEKINGVATINFFDCNNQQRICSANLETDALGTLRLQTGQVEVFVDETPIVSEYCIENGFRVLSTSGNTIKGTFDCLSLISCKLKYSAVNEVEICGVIGDSVVNPFRLGLLGNYRPSKSLLYLTGRSAGHIREAGIYNKYEPYWSSAAISNSNPNNWTWTEQSTKIDPYGRVIETKDTLGTYKSELYGFNNNLVVASAKNAKYQEIANISFEDYDFKNTTNTMCWMTQHFNFDRYIDSFITDETSHTGRRSLQIPGDTNFTVTSLANHPFPNNSSINANGLYEIRSRELIGTFSPSAGDYYIDAWVRIPVDSLVSFTNFTEIEAITDYHDTVYFRPFGPVVEGWQKIGGRFNLKTGFNNIQLRFINKQSLGIYYDDIRLHPFNGLMETYVYDPKNLRLMARLDENNFATIYEYDEEGQLTRIKKETQQGILTVREVRAAKPKQN